MARSHQLALLLVLIGVMVVVYTTAFRKHATPPAADTPAQAAGDIATAPTSALELVIPERSVQRAAQRERTMLLAWSRDPFTRGASLAEGSGLTLAGILWDPQQPLAIINGQTVHVGEELEGYRVTEITSDRVSLTDGTQTFQLSIAP